MPTYDYACDSCDHQLEQFQSITAKPLKKCPQCGKMSLKRLIGSGAGVIFKGSGFYQTDYRSESYKKAKESEKPPSTGAAPEKKSETKKASAKAASDSNKTDAKETA
jgi:putative FmdB family regulatory protein